MFWGKIKKLLHLTPLCNNIMLNKKFQTILAFKLDIKLTFLENNACLVITAAIRHTSTEKLYQGLAQNL